ncbi:SgcJ/EcaC family oxidoreductase [Streptomyces sp. McG3]|uniref:SgcJ/EcaC family oxidoreductase n=1 Tax=Streptomyces sp. McG3 TaxID=2725483 RepID=UPI002036CD94|nr:SgcJ/EcaC family oxidoreductase [Streptomyces sp. McG3]
MTVHDDVSLRAVWRTMAEAWSSGDAVLFGSVFAEDVDFVTVRGEELHGRQQVVDRHAHLFATVHRGTRLEADVRPVREVADDTWLVHAVTLIRPSGYATHAQALVIRTAGAWTITAFHNMEFSDVELPPPTGERS